MSFGGGSSSAPQVRMPDPLPPAPERTSTETQNLADEQRRRFAMNQAGRAATMLTGGSGTSGASAAVRFLGGAART